VILPNAPTNCLEPANKAFLPSTEASLAASEAAWNSLKTLLMTGMSLTKSAILSKNLVSLLISSNFY